MIAKISVGSSFYGALFYNQEKVDQGEAHVLLSNKILENKDGRFNVKDCMESFEMFMPKDVRTEKPVMHISLNPHPEDRLTDQQLSDIAEEYLNRLGYGNQPYIIYKHEDIDRHHIHIVTSRVNEEGRKINDKYEHRRSKEITKDIEQKYDLHKADKKQFKADNKFRKVDYTKGDVKKQVSNTVKGVLSTYNFQSFTELKAALSLYNVHAEEVKGEINGTAYCGIVYSATNDKGEKQGNPFKSSRLGKATGSDAIQYKIKANTKKWKEGTQKEWIKRKIDSSLNGAINRKQFQDNLKEKGIDVILRENQTGRITGVTFIDHNSATVCNGSRLGKEYSANHFENLFNSDSSERINQILSSDPDYTSQTPSGENSQSLISIRNGGSSQEGYVSATPIKKAKKKRRRIY